VRYADHKAVVSVVGEVCSTTPRAQPFYGPFPGPPGWAC